MRVVSCSKPSRPTMWTRLVSCSKPTPGGGDVVRRRSGRRPWPAASRPRWPAGRRSRPRSPTRVWPGDRRRPSSARMSGVGSSTSSGTPSAFFSFSADDALGRKSATAAAITTTSASPARSSTAFSMSAAVSTAHDRRTRRYREADRGDQRDLRRPGPRPRAPARGPACPRSGCRRNAPGRWARGCRPR